VLRSALNTKNSLGFVNDLTQKLDQVIKSTNPKPQTVVDLVHLSQQILLSLSAGVPSKDGAFVRLCPKNKSDWEVIRKALFLALSVTSNPGTAGNTFLSTLYDCGKFYHQKTDKDEVKDYYWQLDAYAKGFSKLWNGTQEKQSEHTIKTALDLIFEQVDPLYWELGAPDADPGFAKDYKIVEEGYGRKNWQSAYKTAIQSISIKDAQKELIMN
jgi:hypothetical protein